MTGLVLTGNHVIANWGRWVALCPSHWCDSAMQVWPGQQHTVCGDCGEPITQLIWPADPEGIEALLALRPAAKLRNWYPGETLQQLLAENLAHGILPPAVDPDVSQTLMVTSDDDRIISGPVGLLIASDTRRHQIEAATLGGH
jgi:hypothetical protein